MTKLHNKTGALIYDLDDKSSAWAFKWAQRGASMYISLSELQDEIHRYLRGTQDSILGFELQRTENLWLFIETLQDFLLKECYGIDYK